MSNSIRNTMEATPLTLALVADCKAKKKSDETGVKAHMLLAEEGYVSTDLMAPSTKGSTCNDGQWAYFNTVFKASLTDTALKLYSYENTDGLTVAQKDERRKIQKRFGSVTNNWRKGLVRLEKTLAEAAGTVAKATYETRVHEKLSTLLKQLGTKEEFKGDIVEVQKGIAHSLTHIKLK
jgi:hypothetical protein